MPIGPFRSTPPTLRDARRRADARKRRARGRTVPATAPVDESAFPDRYINREAARRDFGQLADTYGGHYMRSDELADAVVEAFAAMDKRRGQRMLLQALDHGIDTVPDAPRALVALFEQVDRVPDWVDWERMNLGAKAYRRVGPAAMLTLSAWALMNGYHSAPAIKPLMFTKQLDAMAPRRLAETGRFVIEQIQHDGLRRYSDGFKTAIRVRILHAWVRRMILQSGRWDSQAWGLPINQGDMVGTVLEFSLLALHGTREMGFRFRREEADALIHLWRYSGWLSGVSEELLFDTEEEAFHLAELIHLVQPGPDEDSVALAQALRKVPYHHASDDAFGRAFAEFMVRYHDGMTWAFNGKEYASALKIPNRLWSLSIHPTRAMVRSQEAVRRLLPLGLGDELFAALGNRLILNGLEQQLAEGGEPSFQPVKKLLGAAGYRPTAAAAAATG